MSDPKNVPQVWELIEAANDDASRPQVQFRLYTSLGVFYTQQCDGDYVYAQFKDSSGELRNRELADIIRAKCRHLMKEAEALDREAQGCDGNVGSSKS